MTKEIDELSIIRSVLNTLAKVPPRDRERVWNYIGARVLSELHPAPPMPEKHPGLFGEAS